jgi:cytochrome c-type biogenesis protein CcmH/NrfF
MRIALLPFAAAVLAVALVTSSPAKADLTQSEVEEALTCQCGCGLTVHTCNHLECSFAVPARKDIAESLARGESGEHIVERYKLKYGEKVLSSPIPEGFNILAWVGPYLAIIVAGVAMLLFFRSRARRAAPSDTAPGTTSIATASDSPELDARRARLREEVRNLEK